MSDHDRAPDPAGTLARRPAGERLTRRRFLGRVAAVGAGGAMLPLLAACGGGATASPAAAPATGCG